GCRGRPWLFAELAAVFDGRLPDPPPRLGEIAAIMDEHARRLSAFFGERRGLLQMRKWAGWYIAGFPGGASGRRDFQHIQTLQDMRAVRACLDPDARFPEIGLRTPRAKDGRLQQRVALPHGYLESLDDDTPPDEPADLDAALSSGG